MNYEEETSTRDKTRGTRDEGQDACRQGLVEGGHVKTISTAEPWVISGARESQHSLVGPPNCNDGIDSVS